MTRDRMISLIELELSMQANEYEHIDSSWINVDYVLKVIEEFDQVYLKSVATGLGVDYEKIR